MRGRSTPRLLGGGTPILYADEWRGRSPRNGRAAAAARPGKRKRRGGSERFREALHLGVLASHHSSDRVVASESRRGGDEHHGVRWAVDAQGHRVAGIWHRAREFVARRIARISSDGAAT